MSYNPQQQDLEDVDVLEAKSHAIVIWNDDVNTFDWVIECLVEICHHTPIQAEQCAYLIHTQGKHDVKKGSYEDLKPICECLQDRGLSAEIY